MKAFFVKFTFITTKCKIHITKDGWYLVTDLTVLAFRLLKHSWLLKLL